MSKPALLAHHEILTAAFTPSFRVWQVVIQRPEGAKFDSPRQRLGFVISGQQSPEGAALLNSHF